MAFAESNSLESPPHGLRVKTSRKKYSRLHGVRLTTAYPRIALTTSLPRRSGVARAKFYHPIASTTGLCWVFTFALRLQHALSHSTSLELTPTLHQLPSHCSHQDSCTLLYHTHLYTAPGCNLLSGFYHSHQRTCTMP